MSTRLAKLMLLAAGAFALAAPPVHAAPAAPPVVGDPKDAASRFVRSYAVVNPFNYVVRWRRGICIGVTGLPPDQAAKVKNRIEAVAQSLTERLYSFQQGCGGYKNLTIEFTSDPQKRLDEIIAKSPRRLGDEHSDTHNVKTVSRPIQAWYQTRDCDGVCGPERYYKHLFETLVLVDQKRTAGADLTTIADYVAMLALSEPRSPDGCQALPSVLDLFTGPCQGRAEPTGLTPSDLAYLKAVYTAEDRIWQPVWNAGPGGFPPKLDDVAGRMGMLLAGAAPLPAPGAKPVLFPPAT
jgi:hypothetical protein